MHTNELETLSFDDNIVTRTKDFANSILREVEVKHLAGRSSDLDVYKRRDESQFIALPIISHELETNRND